MQAIKKLLFLLFGSLGIIFQAWSQSSTTTEVTLPEPALHFPLNESNAVVHETGFRIVDVLNVDENFLYSDDDLDAEVNYTTFNSSTGVMYTELSFFGLKNTDPDAITVSLWVNWKSSDEERILFGAKENSTDTDVKWGLAIKNTTLYLKRYYEEWTGGDESKTTVGVPWSYELFPPAIFDAGEGWYMIIAVFDKAQRYMQVSVGKPTGATYGIDNTFTSDFDGRLIWIPGIRSNLKDFGYWQLGPAEGLSFRDFKIYNQSLTFEQATMAWENEAADIKEESESTARVASTEESDEDSEGILVYPNNSDGHFTVGFPLQSEADVSYTVHDLSGKAVLRPETQHFSAGQQSWQIDISAGVSDGIYLLKLVSGEFESTHRIMISTQ